MYTEPNSKNMEYNFVKFEGRNSRFENRITIANSFSIGFPTKFYKDNNVESQKYVVLFWDATNKAIGIHFTNDEKETSKFMLVKTRKYGASVSAKSFFLKNGLDPKEYKGRYNWTKHSQPGVGDIYVIDVSKKAKEE